MTGLNRCHQKCEPFLVSIILALAQMLNSTGGWGPVWGPPKLLVNYALWLLLPGPASYRALFNDLLWTSKRIPRRSEIAQLWIQILNLTDRKSRRPVEQPDHGYIIRLRWLLVSFTSTLFLYKHPRTVTGVWLNQPSQLRSFEIYSPTTMSHSGGSNKNCYSVGLASQLQNHLLQFGIAQKCDLLGETVQLILGYFHESNLRFPPITSSRL